MTAGAPALQPLSLPVALLPAQALCDNLFWPPPDWGWPSGAWNTMPSPSHKRQASAESHAIFNLRACFEEFGFCDWP